RAPASGRPRPTAAPASAATGRPSASAQRPAPVRPPVVQAHHKLTGVQKAHVIHDVLEDSLGVASSPLRGGKWRTRPATSSPCLPSTCASSGGRVRQFATCVGLADWAPGGRGLASRESTARRVLLRRPRL